MRIFQTFILPDNLVAKHGLSFAAANFSRNLISGGGFDKVYSLIPISVHGDIESIDESGYEIVYSQWRKKGRLKRKLAIFIEQWRIFKEIKRGDSIWFYNLNMLNSFLFLLLKLFKPSVKLNVIILDYTPASGWKEQNYWFLKMINAAHGVISLSSSRLFKVKNAVVLPGVVSAADDNWPKVQDPKMSFLLSGVINDTIAMTKSVLEAFSRLPRFTLHITGKVMVDEDLIKSYADKYDNINYYGSISYEKYLDLLHTVTFQLSTRNPEMPENQCNFPSKIIEALLHNRVVVSTIDYMQLDGINYLKVDADNLTDELRRIGLMSQDELMGYANESDKVRKRFCTEVWNECMTRIEVY